MAKVGEYSFDDYLQSARLQPLAGYILTPQQEIRARALDSAVVLVAQAMAQGQLVSVSVGDVAAGLADLTTRMASDLVAWIEHGDELDSDHG